MKIVSLIPSATEIVCSLGLINNLVGISHECDYPQGIEKLPKLTKSKVDVNETSYNINENIQSKCGWSPFHGENFKGFAVATIVNGKIKMKNGKILGEPEGLPLNFN